MSWLLIIVLIVIGLILLLVEILLMPGTAVAGILGLLAIGFSIFETYDYYGAKAGTILLLATLVISVLAIVLALRSKTWNKVMLKESIDSKVIRNPETLVRIGEEGVAVSRLAPSGKGKFEGNIHEVHTYGGFVDEGSKIKVIKFENNYIYVEQIK